MSKIKQFASRLKYKPGESTSRIKARSWTVRDSRLHLSQGAAGTFTGLIVLLTIPAFFITTLLLPATNTHADDSITVTISGSPTITVAPTSEGTFADSGNINISVTNAPASGYTLAITGGGNTSLTGKTDNTKSITSISSAIDQNTFNTSTYNNKWGYKPSKHYNASTGQRADNTNYLPAPDANGDIIDITDDNSSNNYTMSIGARVTSDLGFQTYENNTFVIAAVGNSHVLDCDDTKLCVEYEGNGLTYNRDTLNRVNYNSTGGTETVTKYSHTSNVSDAGIASGTYSNNMDTTGTVTIDGVTSLNVAIYYDTESASYDWVTVYQSPFTISQSNDATVSTTTGNLSGKLAGRNSNRTTTYSSWYRQTYTVAGNTVKFHFRSDGSQVYYGYYAIVTGTINNRERSVASGEYTTPTGTNAIFHGWSTTQTTPGGGLPSQVEYTDEADVMDNIPGNEGETKTLYAVWQQGQAVTFNMDSNVSSIAVLDSSGATVGTITTSGQSLLLAQGDTYTIEPTHASGYVTNAITIASGAGTISGKEFTVGAGATTISVTSKQLCAGFVIMQNLTSSTIASLLPNVGSTATVCDTRDEEKYFIGKLADNKYWMLENLNLAGGTALSANDTNVTSAYISSFSTSNNLTKSGDTIVLPASSTYGFGANGYSYVYNSGNKTNCGASGQNTPCYSYYSWDAATLGSGIGTNKDAQQSICPKGWKLPSTYDGSGTAAAATDFRALMIALGGSNSIQTYSPSTTPTGATMYGKIGPGTTPNFLLAGYYDNSSFKDGGSYGNYWSSTSSSYTNSISHLAFNSGYVQSASYNPRYRGYSVRCLFSS